MNGAQHDIVRRAIHLDHQQMLFLEGRPGRRIKVVYGGAWLSAGNDLRDHFACAGDEVALRSHGRSIIESIGRTGIELTEPLHRGRLRRHKRMPHRYDRPRLAVAAGMETLGDRLQMVRQRVVGALALWARRKRARPRLADLSDHMLRDVGLTRADALHEASKPFWRA